MPYAICGANQVEYFVEGKGTTIVLVHGTGGDASSNWDAIATELAKHWTVVRPNYSGSGETQVGNAPLDVNILSHQIEAVLNALDKDKFHLVGFSLGAAVSIDLSSRLQHRIQSLVLINGFAGMDSRSNFEFTLWRHLIDKDRHALAKLILLTGFTQSWFEQFSESDLESIVEDMVCQTNWEGMKAQVDIDLSIDVRTEASTITVPVLVIASQQDQMVPLSAGKELVHLMPHARYISVDSGHLIPMEHPELVVKYLTDFLYAPS
ncbi:TPA: alpha/beta fold hydrolase [Klebsiella oxytoca]